MDVFEPPGDLTRVLVIAAHPDDIDFGAAGTVATLTKSGVEVTYCLVTNGDAGGEDPSISRAEMAALRQREQRAAAAEVGVVELEFLGHPDGRVTASLDLRRDLSAVIRRVRPEVVLAPSPDRMWDRIYASHPDHLATGEAATSAVYPDARNQFAHPDLLKAGLEPHTVRELWLMASPESNLAVDVTEQFDAKLAALRCHESQVGAGEHLPELLRSWMEGVATAAGRPEGALAEAFRKVNTA